MSRKAKAIAALGLTALVLFFVAHYFAWFAGEPTHAGRTLTQWLDTIVMEKRETNAYGLLMIPLSGAELTNQPGYHALMSIGGKAVPVLMQRVMDLPEKQPEPGLVLRWKKFWRHTLERFGFGRTPVNKSRTYPLAQRDRKNAAGFILVALGTNSGGGFMRFLEAYAAAPKPRVTGPLLGVRPGSIAQAGAQAGRRGELFAAIAAGLQHTNGECRRAAASAARAFPEEAPQWRILFLRLTEDTDDFASQEALFALIPIPPDEELLGAVRKVALDEHRPARVREVARVVLRSWEKAAGRSRFEE